MAYMKAKSLDNKAISDVASDRFDGFPFIKVKDLLGVPYSS